MSRTVKKQTGNKRKERKERWIKPRKQKGKGGGVLKLKR